jgi:WD40 repeat protein/predicted KAP-like P-loop ATPase
MEAPHNLEAVTPKPEKYLAEFKSQVFAVAISPQGREHIAVGLEDGTIEIWNLLTGTKLLSCQGHKGSIWSLAFNHDGTQIVSGSSDRTVRLWDVTTGQAIDRPSWHHRDFVKSVAFNHNSTQVVSGSDDRRVRLWDVETGQAIDRPAWVHNGLVKSVAFNYDGSMLVSGGRDNMVRLWDVTTGEAIDRPSWVHKNFIRSVAFSPDGSMIVSGSWDKTVRLWNVATGQAIGDPFYHTDDVRSVAFSPDGRMIVSGGSDNMVRLWDISDPQHKRQIIIGEHESPIYSVAFDPQEDYIISASVDGIKVWRWQGLNIYRVSQAFSNDQANGEDSLDVTKELQSLADVLMLRSLEPPLAVAILGSWGSGKSFGMHLIEKQITKIRCQKLNKEQTWSKQGEEKDLSPYVGHVYQIKFNAWSYAKSDLWASLMQTIFEQLDRQLTLEKQLRDVLGEGSDLAGSKIWCVLNQMNDSDRNVILASELGEKIFAEFKDKDVDNNALWAILRGVRQEEQNKLKESENKLQELEESWKIQNQEIENKFNLEIRQIEKVFTEEVKTIEEEVEQEMTDISILIVFLSQLKETLKDDFGDSILKDFLNFCEFKDRKDLENQFPMLRLDKLAESNLIDLAQELINRKDAKIETIVTNVQKINHFLEEQPSNIVGLIEFTKKNKKTLLIFLAATTLPFITYFLIVFVIPKFLPALREISTALQLWLTSVSAIPAISITIEIFKKVQILQLKTLRFLHIARENFQEEKQKLTQTKNDKIKERINQRKSEYEKNQVKKLNINKELDKQKLTEKQQEIETLKAQIERQKQRIGLTAQYKSLLDFVNNRLEDNSYQKLLGLMNQIQSDLSDLSDHLTYKPGNTNPQKIEVLKRHFPRGPARIVLYIDDLDRCPPDKVVQVLEAVQLLLNTNIFIIILAIDDRYIGRALEQVYRGVLKRGGTPSGVDYLEKIIQLPYRMRPINKDVTENYLKSLVHIEEEAKRESQENFSMFLQVNQESSFLQQTTAQQEINFLEEVPQQSYEYELGEQMQVYTPSENSTIQDIYEPKIPESHLKDYNRIIQHSTHTDPLVSFERFTTEEFSWISECCQHVDLTPRTAKRLINICKIIKTIWTPAPHDTIWKQEPKKEYKQTLIAFLALAGRYPKEMRKVLEEIYLEFEETDENTVIINKDKCLNRLQNLDVFMDRHHQREWKKFKNDFHKMPPQAEFVFEKRTFNLAVSFCFVGDIGYDPDDNYNREYRFEDRQKQYGFKSI